MFARSAVRTASRASSQQKPLVTAFTRTMATGAPSATAQAQEKADTSAASFNIKNTNVREGNGVKLDEHQRLLVGSVLDLFEGHPTLKHLSLWRRDALFADPITSAAGYDKFAAQWYGLAALFQPIRIQSHEVISGGNPLELNLTNKYVLKGLQKEQVMSSRVKIHVDADGKIEKVEDRWNDKLPDGPVSEAFRKLNAVTVPAFVKVPTSEEEDMKMQKEREQSS